MKYYIVHSNRPDVRLVVPDPYGPDIEDAHKKNEEHFKKMLTEKKIKDWGIVPEDVVATMPINEKFNPMMDW